jgi:hypothetical protein
MIDVNEMRDPAIRLQGLTKTDELYTLYYDETNNIRRLLITPDGLNVRNPQCFVLGGVAHTGTVRDLNVETLRMALNIQKSAKEIKLKHLGKGDFLDLLDIQKVTTFLDWLLAERLFIHYQVLDVMYWSIVDIVDSIVTELGQAELMVIAPALKSDLYAVLRDDLDGTVKLLNRYTYPDVGRQHRTAFLAELIELVSAHRILLPDFNFQMLNGLLEMAVTVDSLPYLEDEDPNVLIDEFSNYYINRICLFKNSIHFFDIEKVIEDRLARLTFVDNGRACQNFSFIDSKHEAGIQVSDVAVGLLGKAFTFFNRTGMSELEDIRGSLSPIQTDNLSRLGALMDQSIAENGAFAHYLLSHEDQRRAAFFFE